eukprot:10683877-Prorocentrum_lima.AAC.1
MTQAKLRSAIDQNISRAQVDLPEPIRREIHLKYAQKYRDLASGHDSLLDGDTILLDREFLPTDQE